jgi:hypothetical protein
VRREWCGCRHFRGDFPPTTAPRDHARTRMGSKKKNKGKRGFAPSPPPSTSNHAVDDSDLVDDLLAELDSRDHSARQEPAPVLEEIRPRQAAQPAPPDKAGSKTRFRARQVRPLRCACSAMVTSLSSRKGKLQRSQDSRRLLMPTPMPSWSGRLRMRNVRSIGYVTSWGSRCTR